MCLCTYVCCEVCVCVPMYVVRCVLCTYVCCEVCVCVPMYVVRCVFVFVSHLVANYV